MFVNNNHDLNLKRSLALLQNTICAANLDQSASLETFCIGNVSSIEQSPVVASLNHGPAHSSASCGLRNSSGAFFQAAVDNEVVSNGS